MLFKSLSKQFKHVNKKKTEVNPQFKRIAAWSFRTTKLQSSVIVHVIVIIDQWLAGPRD